MAAITVVINSKNSADHIESCLESVQFADEILLADMQSTDETLAIAKQFPVKIVSVPLSSHVELIRNQVIEQATSPWVLLLDADERVPKTLATKLLVLADSDQEDPAIYSIARKNIIFSEWLRHSGWWPDYQVRFFTKGAVSWSPKIHQPPETSCDPVELPADEQLAIEHHNYRSLSEFLSKMDRYTTIEAEQKAGDNSTKLSSDRLLQEYFSEFFRRYYQAEGWKDGLHGLTLTLLQSQYQSLVLLKDWEKQGFSKQKQPLSAALVGQVISEWRYWQAAQMVAQSTGISKIYWLLRKKFRW